MHVALSAVSPEEFSQSEFGGCAVGDPRRQARICSVVRAMAGRPGALFPELFRGKSYEMNASYDVLKRKEATPDNIQSTHRERTRERCGEPGVYLLLEDTTDVSYSGGEPIEGLGPLGNAKSSKYKGFRLHSVLAARLPGGKAVAEGNERRGPLELCGIADQQYLVRKAASKMSKSPKPAGGNRRRHVKGELETDRWQESVERTKDLVELPGTRFIRVADREGDFYEYLHGLSSAGFGFVIRAFQNRRMQDPETGKRCGHLLDEARAAPSLGTFRLPLRTRGAAKAREAVLSASALNNVLIQAPQRPGVAQGTLEPVRVSVIRIWEEDPPQNVKEPLEWLLLSSDPAESFEQARECAVQYSCRWIIEEFHKALKTGMGAEDLQLEHGNRLMAAVSMMSVVALRLVDMRERSRLKPDAPARGNGFDETDIVILARVTKRKIGTIREAMRATASLGGFLGRKGDGEPGMQTLWRGTQTLTMMKEGFLLSGQKVHGKKSQE